MLSRNKFRGFSLIELMVVIAIVALLALAALPSFSEYLNNSRVRAAATSLREGLQTARMEALRRNNNVAFCSIDDGLGWEIRLTNCENEEVLRSTPGETSLRDTVTATPADSEVTFMGNGRLSGGVGTALETIELRWKNTCGGDDCQEMNIEISPGGMVRACNPNLPAGDPQACQGE
jgi:type IV fimbrial biogenesis protein FimT